MVEQHHPGSMGPHGGQERHAIPDLDDGVSRAVSARKFCNASSKETRVAPSTSYDLVTVTASLLSQARSPGRPNGHLQAGGCPTADDLVGVDFGSAGFRVIEVAPGQHVYPPDPRGRGERVKVASGEPAGGVFGDHAVRMVVPGRVAPGSRIQTTVEYVYIPIIAKCDSMWIIKMTIEIIAVVSAEREDGHNAGGGAFDVVQSLQPLPMRFFIVRY